MKMRSFLLLTSFFVFFGVTQSNLSAQTVQRISGPGMSLLDKALRANIQSLDNFREAAIAAQFNLTLQPEDQIANAEKFWDLIKDFLDKLYVDTSISTIILTDALNAAGLDPETSFTIALLKIQEEQARLQKVQEVLHDAQQIKPLYQEFLELYKVLMESLRKRTREKYEKKYNHTLELPAAETNKAETNEAETNEAETNEAETNE